MLRSHHHGNDGEDRMRKQPRGPAGVSRWSLRRIKREKPIRTEIVGRVWNCGEGRDTEDIKLCVSQRTRVSLILIFSQSSFIRAVFISSLVTVYLQFSIRTVQEFIVSQSLSEGQL